MEDPRETAWRRRCDYHSHMNAIRVAFTATYAQAIPNARRAQYYKAKLPSVNQWVARRIEHERAIHSAGGEGGGAPEEGAAQDQIMRGALKSVVVNYKERTKKRKTLCESTRLAVPREEEGMLRMCGLDVEMDDSGVFMAEDEVSDVDICSGDLAEETILVAPAASIASVGSSPTEPPPTATVPQIATKNLTKIPPQASFANKKTRFSSRAHASVISSDANPSAGSLRLPKSSKGPTKLSSSKKGCSGDKQNEEASYEILPYWPGTTEVIFDRYPALHKLARAKRGKRRIPSGANRDFRKMPDMSRLIFLCRRAGNIVDQNKTMKSGTKNGVVSGSRQLVFLKRNIARSEIRVKVRAYLG